MRTVRTINRSLWSLAALGALLFPTAHAQAGGFGQPVPWEMSRQVPVTENARDILSFETGLHDNRACTRSPGPSRLEGRQDASLSALPQP